MRRPWLASRGDDPRPELVHRLSDTCRGAGTLLAYYADFERRCLADIGRALPGLREPVDDLVARISDSWPVVRDHVYHPDFNGSFSLKAVLPALVPELSYEGLEIGDGMEASRVLEAMLLRGEPACQRTLRSRPLRTLKSGPPPGARRGVGRVVRGPHAAGTGWGSGVRAAAIARSRSR